VKTAIGAVCQVQVCTELLFTQLYACAHFFAPGPYYPPIAEESKFG